MVFIPATLVTPGLVMGLLHKHWLDKVSHPHQTIFQGY